MTTRLGILGGTFDPIHCGHLDVAAAAAKAVPLDLVWFMPSHVPPHRAAPGASAEDRLAMVEAAIAGRPGFISSDLELRAEGPSYTSATLDRLEASGVETRGLCFVTGADAFREIRTWKHYPAILSRCHFVVVSRPGAKATSLREALPELIDRMIDLPAPVPDEPSILLVDAPTARVSSTDVRRRAASGETLDGLVPPPVANYIETHRLYRTAPQAGAHGSSGHMKERNGEV
jgi:nicotinate-nucleotide adenylyltransferase